MKHLLIILSILLLSSPLFGKETGVLFFRYGNEDVGWYEDDDGSKSGKYLGDIENGKPNGQGKVTWSVGDKYLGEWKEGKYHGDGIYNFHYGDKYVGEFKDGKKHGQGTLTSPDVGKYVGEWKEGKKHGQGTLTSPDVGKYVGEWKEGKKHGQGTLTSPDGGKYVGEWKEGKKHGQGTYTFPDGGKYVGEWKNEEQHGQGTYTWSDGTKYVGEWKNGKRNGQGTLTSPDVGKYVGEFKEGKKHGQGTYTSTDGEKYEGEFKNGKFDGQGTETWSDGKYVGEFKNGKFDGQGTETWSDGKYVGEFKDGEPWNITEYDKNGKIVGKFVNGVKKVGKVNESGTKQWTKQLGTSGDDEGKGVTTDSSGNIYVTGFTEGELDGNTNLGKDDFFLVKYNSSGTKQWTKQLGTGSRERGIGVTTDTSGNIYVTGWTRGGLDGNTNLGNDDIVLVKYDSSGTKQWTKQLGSSGNDYGISVTTDTSGNIYVTGYTSGGLDGNTNSGGQDLFLVKYNSSGTKQWTKQLGTSSDDNGIGVSTDSSGNIYVTGKTRGGLDGNTNSDESDIFLVKYDSSGTKQWTKQLGSSGDDYGMSVTTDTSGNIYVTGYTLGGLDGNTNSGESDIFLVKYNSSGTKQWTKQLGTSGDDGGLSVSSDSSGNIYVTGWTYGGLDGNTNSGSYDIFLVKYNSSGTKQWTKQLGSSSSDKGNGVTTDSSGNIYVTGDTRGGLDGNTNMGGECRTTYDYNTIPCSDVFLVKYNSSGTKQ